MNRDQLRGSWGQLKGRMKLAWGELTNDEELKAEGAADKFYGRIEKGLGKAKQGLKAKVDRVRLP